MIIHHYHPNRGNVGDLFVVDGIRKLLGAELDQANFVHLPVNKPYKDQSFYGIRGQNLEYSNSEADLIVIGGSNLYEPRKNGDWAVVTGLEDISNIKKPVMLIGLGTGSSMRKVRPCSPRSKREIALLNKLAIGSSVRDIDAGQFLESIGVRNYSLTGCPATFVFDRTFGFKQSNIVAVSFPSIRFSKFRFTWYRLMRCLSKYLAFCRGLGLEVVVSCHHEKDLELAKFVEKKGFRVMHSNKSQDYYSLYEQAKFVVSFRLHAAIIALSLGVPFIPISFDSRATAFADTYASREWMIEGTSYYLYHLLRKRTESLLAQDGSSFENFLTKKELYHQAMQTFIRQCLKKHGQSKA